MLLTLLTGCARKLILEGDITGASACLVTKPGIRVNNFKAKRYKIVLSDLLPGCESGIKMSTNNLNLPKILLKIVLLLFAVTEPLYLQNCFL